MCRYVASVVTRGPLLQWPVSITLLHSSVLSLCCSYWWSSCIKHYYQLSCYCNIINHITPLFSPSRKKLKLYTEKAATSGYGVAGPECPVTISSCVTPARKWLRCCSLVIAPQHTHHQAYTSYYRTILTPIVIQYTVQRLCQNWKCFIWPQMP